MGENTCFSPPRTDLRHSLCIVSDHVQQLYTHTSWSKHLHNTTNSIKSELFPGRQCRVQEQWFHFTGLDVDSRRSGGSNTLFFCKTKKPGCESPRFSAPPT